MGKIVGIDLGTTFSAIAHIDKFGKPVIIPNIEGDRTTPSVIHLGSPILVGKAAAQNAIAYPEEIVTGVKSRMGDSKEEFSQTSHGNRYSAEELSAMILKKLKQDAENELRMQGEIPENEDITGACITVPVSFDHPAREATKNAAKIAGFKEVRLIDEPIASAYAYRLHSKDQKVFVFDLGGGTNDVTLLEISDTKIEVVSKNGNRNLGGRNWDFQLMMVAAHEFADRHKIQILKDSEADLRRKLADRYEIQILKDSEADLRLKEEAVRVKEVLSHDEETAIIFHHANKSIRHPMTREDFESLSNSLIKRCTSQCDAVLAEAKVEWGDVDTVLLVGGSTRMPMIREAIAKISGKKIDLTEVNPDTAVALGAAKRGNDILNPSHSPANEPKTELINRTSNPFGVVRSTKEKKHVVEGMIPRGEKIPCDGKGEFTPKVAGQKSVKITVVQGLANGEEIDSRKLDENPHVIGSFELKMPPGVQKTDIIQVAFKYNSDEIVEVEAIGPDGRTETVKIDTSGLDPEEVKEAEKFLQRQEIK